MNILVLNAGSSTLKLWYHTVASAGCDEDAPEPAWKKTIESWTPEAVEKTLRGIPGPVDVIGHRIVHGGRFRQSAIITPEVRAAIERNAPVAPEHNRRVLALIGIAECVFGSGTPQAAVFDTSFHATLPPVAYTYPGPHEWVEQGIRRYGFHGISHAYAARRAARILGRDLNELRLVTCHLGNGASLTAIRGGKSIDTTMGFTPLEGLMMGSRSGSIDPGILIYLQREYGYTAERLDDLLNRRSGLLGVSGLSADMREILEAIERRDERARFAFDLYTHRLVRETGSMIAVLGGADALVFTGGIGENCAPLREAVARQFAYLPDLRILVVHAEEEWEIARECFALISAR
jgi:acetate kinase